MKFIRFLKKYPIVIIRNFTIKELECPCCKKSGVVLDLVINLQAFRNLLSMKYHRDIRIHVNSAYRCPKHNHDVGGVPNSQHVLGKAVDIWSPDLPTHILYNDAIDSNLFSTIIYYKKSNFIHIDIRNRQAKKYWEWDK